VTKRPIRRALISVYDKTGLVELGAGLAGAGVQIVSTGSTAAALRGAGVRVIEVEELTGFPRRWTAGQDAAPEGARRGCSADLRNPSTSSSCGSSTSRRSTCW